MRKDGNPGSNPPIAGLPLGKIQIYYPDGYLEAHRIGYFLSDICKCGLWSNPLLDISRLCHELAMAANRVRAAVGYNRLLCNFNMGAVWFGH